MFQRQHYELLASVIGKAKIQLVSPDNATDVDIVVEALIDRFRQDNPRFNAVRFRDAILTAKERN